MLSPYIILFFLLLFLTSLVKSEMKNDFRYISFTDLQITFDRFWDPGITTYSQLLFDIDGRQVFVGARDVLYRLRMDNLSLIEKAGWPSTENKTSLCFVKGQSEQDCHNYIKVLLKHGNMILACGTNSYSPQCSWREKHNISHVIKWIDGIAKCPYNPHANITALISRSGEYYVGGPTDFSGSDAAIYRSAMNSEKHNTLRTNQYNSKWLNEPQFVGSFETDSFVYFIFREAAVEYINCGKVVYSRIARICKNDSGGQRMLKDNWTTFIKARLNCSVTGDYPFYFNEVQGIAYVQEERMMYATFRTPPNSIAGSAICAFNMTAIDAVFSGPFKHQEHSGSTWEKHYSPYQKHFECQLDHTQDSHLIDSSRYQLMNNAVQSTTLNPLHVAELESYTHIAIDVLKTKSHSLVNVIFVATTSGLIKKIIVLPKTLQTCVIEIWNPIPPKLPKSIQALHFSKETNSVYIGTYHNVLRIKVHHCKRHVSKNSCLNAMDPYCGWNELQEACSFLPDGDSKRYWRQSITSCPLLDVPVDGGWSSWSKWHACMQKNNNDVENSDNCLCQTRQCNNPLPQNDGASCKGVSIAVTNCTVHGGWTPWSAWSACSQTCGMAVKTRRRSCTNPSPAHGGRVCVGQDYSEVYCASNPPCPTVQIPPRDGQWSVWGNWEECTAPCGGGYRIRRRRCDNPPPRGGGQDCQGSNIEYEKCKLYQCPEYKKMGSWSQWLITNNGSSNEDGYVEKRFRCACRAQTSDSTLIKVSIGKEEERYCSNDGMCKRKDSENYESKWSDWSNWSECTAKCDIGQQFRTRQCEGRSEQCAGLPYMVRSCNIHSCRGEWGCWSDWSSCSVTCGIGLKHRKRSCFAINNKILHDNHCEGKSYEGKSYEEKSCEMPSCTSLIGWDKWSTWSLCDENGEQHRKRKCRTSNPGSHICQGDDMETRICISKQMEDSNEVQYESSIQMSSISTGVVLAYCLAGFITGLACACFLFFFYTRRKTPRIPSSPHFMTAKQNPYITVPLQDVPSKRNAYGSASSSNATVVMNNTNSNTGGTLKLYPKTMSDYDTATIKRNSHTLNNSNLRNDSDVLDKYF